MILRDGLPGNPGDRSEGRRVTGIEPRTDGLHRRKGVTVFGPEVGFRLGNALVLVSDH